MMRTLFLLSLLANAFFSLHAQPEYQYFGGNTVIAPSGINMRQAPGLKAKKMGAIPYGEKVVILDSMVSVFDTVEYIHTIHQGKEYHNPVVGGWIKVQYQQKIGYVFTGLIGHMLSNGEGPEIMIRDLGFACDDLFFDMREYHWYGLFPGKHHTELRKINPTIYDFSEELPSTIFSSGEKEVCLMIIASRTPLPEESIQRPGGLPVSVKKKDLARKPLLMPTFSLHWKTIDYRENQDTECLHIKTQGKDYPLFWAYDAYDEKTLPFGGHPLSATDLIWYGDLNSDGYLDFIVRSEFEYGTIILFMGSQDKMKAVANFVHGPCC